jgi:hypothetical protein
MENEQPRPRCKRRSGTERAWFKTREEAVVFAKDPKNHPAYENDIPAFCQNCEGFHLSPPSSLPPELTHRDFELLESMGVQVPARVPGEMTCARCGVVFREGVDFLILRDGSTVCHAACQPEAQS